LILLACTLGRFIGSSTPSMLFFPFVASTYYNSSVCNKAHLLLT
jgi:hypothetical protein